MHNYIMHVLYKEFFYFARLASHDPFGKELAPIIPLGSKAAANNFLGGEAGTYHRFGGKGCHQSFFGE